MRIFNTVRSRNLASSARARGIIALAKFVQIVEVAELMSVWKLALEFHASSMLIDNCNIQKTFAIFYPKEICSVPSWTKGYRVLKYLIRAH